MIQHIVTKLYGISRFYLSFVISIKENLDHMHCGVDHMITFCKLIEFLNIYKRNNIKLKRIVLPWHFFLLIETIIDPF